MSFSIFGDESPPKGVHNNDQGILMGQRNGPVAIEQNVSYTRTLSERPTPTEMGNGRSDVTLPLQKKLVHRQEEHSNEDRQFLRLAHEALVATTEKSNMLVDPTIQDLLARLKYAQSPHGNPMLRSEKIHANDDGQLMIQNFYQGFPNMSNDIFTSANHPSSETSAWNFLLDKESPRPAQTHLPKTEDPEGDSPENDDHDDRDDRDDDERKFPCAKCSMSFRRSSDLKRHEKQHLKIPANICPDCGKGFARKDALKRHRGTLTCRRNKEKRLHHHNLQYLS